MIGTKYLKDNNGKIIGTKRVPFIEIPENYEVKTIKSYKIIKSQVAAINILYQADEGHKLFKNNTSKEINKLYNLSFAYLNYASERQDYEIGRNKPQHSINITIEQVGSYLCCLSIELLLKTILFDQRGNLEIDGKIVHSIKKNWNSIELDNPLRIKYDSFINEVDLIYGKNGDKLRYNHDINGNDFSDYEFDYETLLNNSKSLFNDLHDIIFKI